VRVTSTLGRELAQAYIVACLDTDDLFWEPTHPPYQRKRERGPRQQLLMGALTKSHRWVLSGSICGWGDVAIPLIDLAVFVVTAVETRIMRLQAREQNSFGRPDWFGREHARAAQVVPGVGCTV